MRLSAIFFIACTMFTSHICINQSFFLQKRDWWEDIYGLSLVHLELPKLYEVLAVLSAKGLIPAIFKV